MTANPGIHVLTDARWTELEPLINAVRPPCKVPHETCGKRSRRSSGGTRTAPSGGPSPANSAPGGGRRRPLIRWAHLGVWERLLDLVQQRGIALGMTFLDGTNLRAHQKAAGAKKRGPTARSATAVSAWPLAWWLRHQGRRDRRRPCRAIAFALAPARRTNCRWHQGCWTACLTSPAGWSATVASPPMPSASGSGHRARPAIPPSAPTRRSPARTGSTTTATWSRTSGHASKNGGGGHPLRDNRHAPSSASSVLAATFDWLRR